MPARRPPLFAAAVTVDLAPLGLGLGDGPEEVLSLGGRLMCG